MQKITPFLWFDHQAEEAVKFYTSLFPNSSIGNTLRYTAESAQASGMKEGEVLTVGFQLCGEDFGALNGGPIFKFTPAVSFFVRCETEEELDRLWKALVEGGNVMMELGAYPFSKKYGWLSDRFGVSWQLNLDANSQKIAPALLFTQEKYGQAQEAIDFYTSLFPNSKVLMSSKRTAAEAVNGEREGTLSYALFTLNGQELVAMESGGPHKFTFSEALSFLVKCETQEEIDMYWNTLSAVKESEQCGWLKDKYGVSWQIVPTILDTMLADKDPAKAKRAMTAMLQMKKLDIATLQKAFDQA